MAQVPTYDLPTVTPQGLPGVTFRAPQRLMMQADIGPGEQIRAGQALESSAGQLGRDYAQQLAYQNEAQAKTAEASTTQLDTNVLLDPETGVMALKGQAAVDAAPKALQGLQDARRGILDGIDNPRVRDMVAQQQQATLAAAQRQVAQHVAQQSVVAANDASTMRMQTEADAAVKSYDPTQQDNSEFARHIAEAQGEVQRMAQLAGVPVDAQAQWVKDKMAPVYSALVNHLMDDPSTSRYAKQAFDDFKGEMDTPHADALAAKLEKSDSVDKVLAYVDNLNGKPIDEQLKQIKDDFDSGKLNGREREAAETRVERLQQRAQAETQRAAAQAVGKAQDWILHNQGKDMMDMASDPAMRSTYLQLEAGGHLAALQAFADRFGGEDGGAARKSDPNVLFNVITHAGDGGAQDIARMPDAEFMKLRGYLSDPDFKRYTTERAAILNGTHGKDPGSLDTSSFREAVNERLEMIGVDPKPKAMDDKQRLGGVMSYLQQSVLADQSAAGKRFNQDEINQSLDRAFMKSTTVKGLIWDSDKKLVALNPGDVPDKAKAGLTAALKARGNANPSDQDILNAYRQVLSGR